MKLTETRQLDLPRDRVWAALNDDGVLARCIPGCDQFLREDENRYVVSMTATVGPIKARFTGRLTISEIEAPTSYALTFEGTGGAAGFGKGSARVSLVEAAAGGTQLTYSVEAQVGGKLAQVGGRLIDSVAKRLADDFFTRLKRDLLPEESVAAAAPVARSAEADVAKVMPVSEDARPLRVADTTPRPAATAWDSSRVAVLAAGVAVLGACVSVLTAVVLVVVR